MDGAAPLNPYAYECRYGVSAWTEPPVEEDIHGKEVNAYHGRKGIESAQGGAMKSARFWEGFFAAAVLASALLASSCGSAGGNDAASSDASSDQAIEATQQDSQESDSSSPSDAASGESEGASHTFQASSNTGIPDGWDEWSEDAAPNYVYEVGAAVVRHDADAGEYRYSDLDSLGRTQEAYAVITHQDRSHAEKRGRTHMDSSIKPSGWGHNDRFGISLPNGKTYHGYLWNRSHLIADSLGGAMRVENMITGTRTQNVGANDGEGGMGYCETIARDWLDRHADGALYYAAMPLYVGDEPVARAVLVDMKSSDGTIDSEYIVYNAAKGCVIDYATGEASAQTDESASTAAAASVGAAEASVAGASDPEADAEDDSDDPIVYITKSGKRYHASPDCPGLNNANKIIEARQSEAESKGKTPCKIEY